MKNIKNAIKRFLAITVLYGITLYLMPPVKVLSNSDKTPSKPKTETSIRDGNFGNIPVYFEENQGQFDKRVKYFARGTSGYSLFLTGSEAVYVLQDKSQDAETQRRGDGEIDDLLEDRRPKTKNRKAVAVYMKLTGANENAVSIGLEEMPHKTNYFKGEEANWRTEIPNFRQIRMNNLYQGIDTVWKGKPGGAVQYDFIVKPNANPNLIEWEIEGAETVEIDEKGDLLIKTEYGEIRQQKPFTYQENSEGLRQEVESGFKISNSTTNEQLTTNTYRIKFELGNYDRSKTLTIDPSVNLGNLSFSTLLDGPGNDTGWGIAVDRAGNVYVAGQTNSEIFPTTPGSFDPTYSSLSQTEVFVSKFNAAGTSLIYSTYIGGIANDYAYDIAVDASGNAFITGRTDNAGIGSYPTTTGAFDEDHNGSADAFVTKLNPSGSQLVYSTLIGGGGSDFANSIGIDANGNAYITGQTESNATPYPTVSAFDNTHNGVIDAFVTKIDSTGSSLVYSTFIGGNADDIGNSIAVSASGGAYITGETDSSNFPTAAAYDTSLDGSADAFVTRLAANGASLVYSTYLGSGGFDGGTGIALDSFGNIFVTGITDGGNFPTTSGAFDINFNGGQVDAFATKLNRAGIAGNLDLIYSTYLGGSGTDIAEDIAIDLNGTAYITGQTGDSTDYPVTPDAYDQTFNGSSQDDVFVTRLRGDGRALLYSTFIGGITTDRGYAIALDADGNAFITGETFISSNYPVTTEVFQSIHNGAGDVMISKLGDYSISGKTVDQAGIPLPNSAVGLSGDNTGFMLSDADGLFYFGDTLPSIAGNYLVSATNTLYNFNPSNYQLTVNRNKQITFVGRPTSSGPTAAPADLGGEVRSTAGNVGLPNTKLTLIDVVSGDVFATTTDANGDYEFQAVTTGMFYLVVPEREGYNFNPGIREVNHLEQNLGLDFVASPNSPRPVRDFDGDGKTDFAVLRPENGVWYILNTQDNSVTARQFGLSGDIPVASDYDGDNRADIAVYRPTEGNWYWLNSTDGEFHAVHFGQAGDLPVQADFDGDNKTDLAVYRPSTGVWHRLLSDNGNYQATKFGIETDLPIAADYDNDGKADLTMFRDGIWYRLKSSDGGVEAFQFGLAEDKPQTGDFDGDGRMDTAVYRPSNGAWYWLESSDGDFQAKQFGNSTDIPVPADYNGDGRFEQAVFRNGTWFVLRHDNSYYASQFGQAGDIPISDN